VCMAENEQLEAHANAMRLRVKAIEDWNAFAVGIYHLSFFIYHLACLHAHILWKT
jgi:hypothetical protein